MIKEFKYNDKTQLTKNINVSELKCKGSKHIHKTKVDLEHINNIQDFMNKNGFNKVIFSSGYRCKEHDKAVGGSGSGQHTLGTATDLCFYKGNKVVDAKEVCCLAQDYGFKGIAYIDSKHVHLDNRTSGTYKGDERKGRSNNVGGDFYKYFGIEKPAEWNVGTYKLLYAKCLRTSPKLGNNIVKVKNCNSSIKKMLTSSKANSKAMIKAGASIKITAIIKNGSRIWGAYGNCYLCLCNADGTKQAIK